MRFKSSLVAILFLVLLAAPAGASNWSLGANLGFALLSPTASNSKSTTAFAWPNQAPIPGLRVGFTGQNPQHEIFFDTALLLTSQKDRGSTRDFTATANYQYNFTSSGSVAPFVTFGGGLVLTGLKDETVNPTFDISASSAIFGGGVGIRHKMGNGHGTLRAEARFDRITEGKDTVSGVEYTLIPETNAFQVKLGFDLWDK